MLLCNNKRSNRRSRGGLGISNKGAEKLSQCSLRQFRSFLFCLCQAQKNRLGHTDKGLCTSLCITQRIDSYLPRIDQLDLEEVVRLYFDLYRRPAGLGEVEKIVFAIFHEGRASHD